MNIRRDVENAKEDVLQMICENKSKRFIYSRLKCKAETLERYLAIWGIKYIGRQGWQKGQISLNKKSYNWYLENKKPIGSHKLKCKLFEEGIKEKICEVCYGIEWNKKPIPLELHHIDGDDENIKLENLQIICPNCHALTDNHAGKGKRLKRIKRENGQVTETGKP